MTIEEKELKMGNGITYHSRVSHRDLRVLISVMNSLRGAKGSQLHSLKGMFWRSYDFDTSTRQLARELTITEDLTDRFMSVGYLSSGFREEAKSKGIIFNTRSERGFKTISLDVALRHFINDACRVLEASARLLEVKTGSPRSRDTLSISGYIKELDRDGVSYGFDGTFFIALYEELWNDYKHAESNGIWAGGYSLDDNNEIIPPKIYGDRLNFFKDRTVDDFLDDVLENMEQFVDFIK